MRTLRGLALAGLLGMALVAAPFLVAPAHADPADPDVYTTPGGHYTNGRYWFTNCEMYSSDVVRCRTEIWAHLVTYTDGKYRRMEGWNFNNLTYLPAPAASWAGNNLARDKEWTSGDRRWRTECNTAVTGSGGCRSYVWTKKVRAVGPIPDVHPATFQFEPIEGWVFNNIVMFSSAPVPAITQIPSYVLDRAVLDWRGFGPLKLGASLERMIDMGYLTTDKHIEAGYQCNTLEDSAALRGRGIRIGNGITVDGIHPPMRVGGELFLIQLRTPFASTIDGAQVGMTIGQIRVLYGDDFDVIKVNNYTYTSGADHGRPIWLGRVFHGDSRLLFLVTTDATPLAESDKVTRIFLEKTNKPDGEVPSLC